MNIAELLQSLSDQIPMPEVKSRAPTRISEVLMLARLAQSEQMREFFIEMWLQNPAMARQAGSRVQAMLSPLGAVPPKPTFVHGSSHG